jgi:hypothetical protein
MFRSNSPTTITAKQVSVGVLDDLDSSLAIDTRNMLKLKSLLPKTAFSLYKLKKGLYLNKDSQSSSILQLYGGIDSPSRA